jgi:predicted RNase H-like HicB family nuclease
MQTSFQARIWYVIERAASIPSEWVAHCLDFDVVTQGRDAKHAFEMLQEAVGMVVVDDLQAGRDPRARRAPEEHWQRMSKMLDSAERRPATEQPPLESPPGAVYIYEIIFSAVRRVPARPQSAEVEAAFSLQAA